MQPSTLFLSLATATLSLAQSSAIQVPVPWAISNIQISNTRHGTGGTWQFSIIDTPTVKPQGFNTTCRYYDGSAYYFAYDGAPLNALCDDKSVSFSLVPKGQSFEFNVTHIWDCAS